MKIIYGLGCILSTFLYSCWIPLPPISMDNVALVYVWDAEILSDYEELQVTFSLSSYASVLNAYLTNAYYNDVVISFPVSLFLSTEGKSQAQVEGIRFSYFDKYLPRGVYTLTLVGKAGQTEKVDFFLEEPYCDFDWKSFVSVEAGKLNLNDELEWRKYHDQGRKCYLTRWKGKSLLIKDFPQT